MLGKWILRTAETLAFGLIVVGFTVNVLVFSGVPIH